MGLLPLPLWLRRENCAVTSKGTPTFVAGNRRLAPAADGFAFGLAEGRLP